MSRPAEIAELVRQGKAPTEIAAKLRLSMSSVEGYLHRAVGEGLLRRSDIYFSVPRERRNSDRTLVSWYTDTGHALGDMYEDIRRIEIKVHKSVREALVRSYGDGEAGWWRKGVPERVRVKCQERRERDVDEPCEPFCYSDLLDLDAILEDSWPLLNDLFPDYRANRKQLSKDLKQLNRIRNKVMHPVRGLVPSEEEFDFVHRLQRALQCWDVTTVKHKKPVKKPVQKTY
jgi:hypothetical protein